MSNNFLIGVDGGGSGCRAAIGTVADGILAKANGGPANITSDPDTAIQNILATINAAAALADIPQSALKLATAHLGLAGIMTPADSAFVAAALPCDTAVITDDIPTSYRGAFGAQNGVLISIGTGTIIASQHDGKIRSIGGWGLQLSDQASGAWLGQSGLRQVLLCHDGIAVHTALTRTLFSLYNNDPNSIVAFSTTAKPGDYAALAPAIIASATDGDVYGQEIMQSGADYLHKALRLFSVNENQNICLTGGIGPHYAPYLPAELCHRQVAPIGNALDGAFQMAKSHKASA